MSLKEKTLQYSWRLDENINPVIFHLIHQLLLMKKCISKYTVELESCSYNNYKPEDDALSYLYKEIIKTFPGIKVQLNHSQRLWLKARDEICVYTSDNGAENKTSQNACMYQQAYERNRELKAVIMNMKQASRCVEQPMPESKWNDYIKYHCEFMGKQFSDSGCKDRNEFLHSSQ